MSLDDLKLGSLTNRMKIGEILDIDLSGWKAVGINRVEDIIILWVNLEKDITKAKYNNGFIDKSPIFQWECQKKQDIYSKDINDMIYKEVTDIHLFCRISDVGPHTYMGKLKYMKHEDYRPLRIFFKSVDFDQSNKNCNLMNNHSPSNNRI